MKMTDYRIKLQNLRDKGINPYHLRMTMNADSIETLICHIVDMSTLRGLSSVIGDYNMDINKHSVSEIKSYLIKELTVNRNIKTLEELYSLLSS